MTPSCTLCGEAAPPAAIPTPILVPVRDSSGVELQIPGVYPLCKLCRVAVSVAEKAAKRIKAEEAALSPWRACPGCGIPIMDCTCATVDEHHTIHHCEKSQK